MQTNYQQRNVLFPYIFLLFPILFISCSKDSLEESKIDKFPAPQGIRRSSGDIAFDNRVLLDKDMRFVTLFLPDVDYEEAVKGNIDLEFLKRMIYSQYFKDDFDFMIILTEGGSHRAFSPRNKCDVSGIGCTLTTTNERLKSYIIQPGIDVGGDLTLHEIGHYWGNYGIIPTTELGHWGFSSVGGLLGGFDEVAYLGNKTYRGRLTEYEFYGPVINGAGYGNLELYLMGLIAKSELQPITVAVNPKPLENQIDFTADTLSIIEPEALIAQIGERMPSEKESQKHFKAITVVISKEELRDYLKKRLNYRLENLGRQDFPDDPDNVGIINFWSATGGRAILDTKISEENIKAKIQ